MLPNDGQSQNRAVQSGRMTAMMRAVRAPREGQRILRIGLVRGGRILEERVFKTRAPVTIGPGEDATFISADIGHLHRLFESFRGVYFLNLLPAMRGKIAQDEGIAALEQLVGQTQRVQLSDGTRGRVVLGDTTLIFQFVDPLPPAATPRLPLAVKTGLFDVADWRLTMIVALSFLAHFGLIGAMYSDWSDPVIDDARTVKSLIDLAPRVPAPPIEPAPEISSDDAKMAPPLRAPLNRNEKPRYSSFETPKSRAPVDDTAALVDRAERIRISMMMSFGRESAVQKAIDRDLPPIVLPHADANVTSDRDLSLRTDAPLAPTRNHMDLSAHVSAHAEAHDHVTATAPSNGPTPSFSVDVSVPTQSAAVPSVERTIAQLRPAFRRCYEQGLQTNSGMAGAVTMRIKIRPNGEVESAVSIANSGLSPEVAQCISRRIQLTQFEAPHGAGSSIEVPVKFVKQR